MEKALADKRIAVIGLGYVGLPLALEFATKYYTIGFDINRQRVAELRSGMDHTLEADEEKLEACNKSQLKDLEASGTGLFFSASLDDIASCNVFFVTVPTPVDTFKVPDLKPLLSASSMLGKVLKKGDLVIYESTTYPGCTEEDCVPVLERESGLTFNKDFYCGYSPERINPGDKVNTLTTIRKVTSGSTNEIAETVDALYNSIITAGTHKASSIKVAEASKAIENAQRDVNISFVNELALIFDRMGIDTNDVLAAAGSKWNFLPFKPGLVGGHCIGVDPYYLAFKAESLGYYPEVILSGRRVNDNMGKFVADKVIKLMIKRGRRIGGSKCLVLGFTFKENCPDIRNTRVIDIVRELENYGVSVDVHDPWAMASEVKSEYGISLVDQPEFGAYKSIVLAVAHHQFLHLNLNDLMDGEAVVFDTKGFFPREKVDARL